MERKTKKDIFKEYFYNVKSTYDVSKNNRRNTDIINNISYKDSLEVILYNMFSINIENLSKTKLYICKDYHIQPSEIMKLPYYEYEYILENIHEIEKKEEEKQKQEEKQQQNMENNMNPGKMIGNISNSMPTVKIPKF